MKADTKVLPMIMSDDPADFRFVSDGKVNPGQLVGEHMFQWSSRRRVFEVLTLAEQRPAKGQWPSGTTPMFHRGTARFLGEFPESEVAELFALHGQTV